MKGLRFLSMGKLRYGYGIVGGQNVGDSQWASTISLYHFNGYVTGDSPEQQFVLGGVPARLANPSVKWENNISQNIGLDLGFFLNKLTLTADYFQKKNDGMLVKVPLPDLAGLYVVFPGHEGPELMYPLENAGIVENEGYEFTLGYKNMDNELKYSIDFNYSHYSNKLVSIAGGQDFSAAQFSRGIGYVSVGKEGYPLGVFWGYQTNGIFKEEDAEIIVDRRGRKSKVVTNQPFNYDTERDRNLYMQPQAQPGDIRYVDQNGDNVLDDEDLTMIGNPHPDFTIGLNANLMYKGFDLSLALQGVYGNEIFNGMKFTYYNTDGGFNWHKDMLNAYRSPVTDKDGNITDPGNTNTNIPRLDPDNNNGNMSRVSDFFVEDGSFLRIKNVQLGYTLSQNILNALKAKKLRVYVAAHNLHTFTRYSGLDPEIGQGQDGVLDIGVDRGAYPQARSYSLGVNLTF
ncbi:MAG: hypothetical protein HC896_03790 [Bacteroidales bacterium]|nr:hypothetical protein [Bacteroidales bacterium]